MNLFRKNKAILKFISVSLASVMTISPLVYSTELSLPDNIITAFAYNIGNYKVNTTSGLRLRSEPNTSSTIFCGIPDGTQIYVEQINGDWGYVRDIGGWNNNTWVVKSGWVNLSYCNYLSSSNYSTGRYKVNTKSGLRLRSEPNTNATIFCGIPYETIVNVEQVNGNWGYVRDTGGWNNDTWVVQSGWVSLDYCEYSGPLAPPETTPPTTTSTTTTTTTTTTNTTTTNPMPSNSNFTFGQDNYSFLNKRNYFSSDFYNVSDKYKKYFSDVSNKSWENIKYYTENSGSTKWKGSCYGLACVQILAKSGLIKVSDIEKNAGSLYDLSAPKDNENVESLINFYHLQQYTENGDKKLKSMLASMSNSARVDKVIDFAKKAQNGDTPALLVFNFSSNKNEGKLKEAHAVVIYGIEYGDWTIDKCGDKYDCRILISDSNTTGFDKDYCMYINTKNHSWEIPYYDNNGMGYCKNTNSRNDSYAQIQYVTNDLAFIDQLQYASSDTKPTEETPDYSSISINTADTSFGVSYYENNSSGINSSVIDLIYFGSSINGAGDNTVNAILPTADVSYEYDARDKADFNTVIDYTNSRLGADVKNGSYAVYKPDKSVEFHGDDSEYSLSMILNKGYHPTDWYKIEVSGDNADNASLSVTDEGYVLESDNLKDGVSVSVSDRDKTANLNLYTSYNKILIHEVNDTTIGIRIDTDGDGKFETDYSPSYLGDVNQDGMISIADAVILQKYLLLKADVSKIQYIASDLNMDGSVDAFDMVSLRQKLINK